MVGSHRAIRCVSLDEQRRDFCVILCPGPTPHCPGGQCSTRKPIVQKTRDEAKLMVIDRKDYSIQHRQFKDMIEYFNEDDIIILNNTKVFPARLYGNKEKTGARIEVFLLRELANNLWEAMVKPARKVRIGNKLILSKDISTLASDLSFLAYNLAGYT